MLFQLRKAGAVFVMMGSVGFLIAVLTNWGIDLRRAGILGVLAALLVGTVALARGAWWGRFLPLAWSASLAVLGLTVAPVKEGYGTGTMNWGLTFLGGAILLPLCLVGREMFARYEGQAPPPLDWTRPGMRLVRAAVVANLSAFLGGMVLAPAIFAWRQHYDPYATIDAPNPDPTALLAICLAMTVLMLIGVVLLARQRTAGLFLVAIAAVGVPLVLIANREVLKGPGAWIFMGVFGPALLCGWVAVGRFVPGMVRLLRR
jgi:hypothetical protein